MGTKGYVYGPEAGRDKVTVLFKNSRGLDSPDYVRLGTSAWVDCPACETHHWIDIVGEDGSLPEGPSWEWNGDIDRPTFIPSLLVRRGEEVCHSNIRDGKWEYLPDSTHALAGQTVNMITASISRTPRRKRKRKD